MEPEVHLIDKYFQTVLNCFTMTNIRCKGNKEIDLLAINPNTKIKYHIEPRVTTTFKLRLEATYTAKGRCHKNGVDFLAKEKFNHPYVVEKIHEVFGDKHYEKWLVVWRARAKIIFIAKNSL